MPAYEFRRGFCTLVLLFFIFFVTSLSNYRENEMFAQQTQHLGGTTVVSFIPTSRSQFMFF